MKIDPKVLEARKKKLVRDLFNPRPMEPMVVSIFECFEKGKLKTPAARLKFYKKALRFYLNEEGDDVGDFLQVILDPERHRTRILLLQRAYSEVIEEDGL